MSVRINNVTSLKRRRFWLTLLLGLWIALFLACNWSSDFAKLVPNVFETLENKIRMYQHELKLDYGITELDVDVDTESSEADEESPRNWEGQPPQEPLDAIWQRIAHTKNKFYVFSAFLDRRLKEPAIRVIAATQKNLTDEVFCRVWLSGDNTSHILDAEIKVINVFDRSYPAAFVLCLLKELNPEVTIGGSIAIVSRSAAEKLPTNLLKIIDTTPKNRSEPNLHICIKPFDNSIDRAVWMVEWIELNSILGVSHFYFYNQKIGKRLDCFLRNYPNRNQLFTYIHFPLPFEEFDCQAQLAATNDCLYRSMSQAEWILSIDVDEVVLPHKLGLFLIEESKNQKDPLPTMFESLASLVGDFQDSKPSAFLFENAHFYFDFEDDQYSPVPLVTSRKTRRREITKGDYMKYAVRTSKAVELNTHDVREMVPDCGGTHQVNPYYALMHHYRVECRDEENCTSGTAITNSTVDRTAHMWVKQLWKRVDQKLTELYKLCP